MRDDGRARQRAIGELHALLRGGDTGYQKAEADVKFFDAGRDSTLIVDVGGHCYLIMIKDIGVSARAADETTTSFRKLNS